MHAVPVWYDLSRMSNRRWLGVCVACHYLIASTLAVAIHEGGHAIAHIIMGDTVYCLHVTPFSGQVLALYPLYPSVPAAVENLSGIATTQLTFLVLAGLRIGGRRWTGFFWDSLYLMFLIVLAFDAVYLLVSGPIHFGDVYQTTKALRWPSAAFVVPGVAMCWLNYRIVHRLIREWSGRYFGGTTPGSRGTVLRWFFVVVLPAIFVYWAFVSPMESPW
jgi:hypothetical protein